MSTTETDILGKIQEQAAMLEGESLTGVAAWSLNSETEKAPVLFNADVLFPTASTIKVPILHELYRQAEAGLVDLNRRIEVTPEHLVPGSGVLQDLAMGLNPTVRDLAVLMIVVSDNTATDILLDIVGREQVEKSMRDLGLTQTWVAMTIRELLYSLAGLDVNDPTHTYHMARQLLDDPNLKVDPASRALSETDNDLSTPRELAQLLTLIANHQTLSESACEEMLDILSRQKFNQIIPLHLSPWTKVAHKTGSLGGVRNDVGVVYGPQPYVIALMSKKLANEVDGSQKLARISGLIYEYFSDTAS
jgi:beta-lactamase class A